VSITSTAGWPSCGDGGRFWREGARPSQVKIGADEASDADRRTGRPPRDWLARAARADERRWWPRDERTSEEGGRLATSDLARVNVAAGKWASALGVRASGRFPGAEGHRDPNSHWLQSRALGRADPQRELLHASQVQGSGSRRVHSSRCGLGAYAPGWITRDCVLHGPSLVHAAVTDTRAEAVDLVYANGTRKRLRLVRVGKPISASFFLYELPRDRLAPQTKPTELRVLDRRGKLLWETPFLSPATGCRSLL